MAKPKESVQLSVRFPARLKEVFDKRSKKNFRSISKEIIYALCQTLTPDEKKYCALLDTEPDMT
jgi:hypothetical protein